MVKSIMLDGSIFAMAEMFASESFREIERLPPMEAMLSRPHKSVSELFDEIVKSPAMLSIDDRGLRLPSL